MANTSVLAQRSTLFHSITAPVIMAARPGLSTSNLPGISEAEQKETSSPARGKEMRANLLQKLRPPPLVHTWDFWHDRQDRNKASAKQASSSDIAAPGGSAADASYEDRLVHLATVTDVKEFWSLFNNFDISTLPLRDSIHLFHKGVKPVWEDPRNLKGGSWTFRVPKDKAKEFWKEMCMMAVGENLQEAVASNRISTSFQLFPFRLPRHLC